MKIDFVNKGEEFKLPTVSFDSDIQSTIDFLKIQARTQRETAKELGVDLKTMLKEITKAQADKNYELSEDAKTWNSITAIQMNLDTVYYVLHKVDSTVTNEKVSSIGGARLAQIVMEIFPPLPKPDFQKATETTSQQAEPVAASP